MGVLTCEELIEQLVFEGVEAVGNSEVDGKLVREVIGLETLVGLVRDLTTLGRIIRVVTRFLKYSSRVS